MKPVSPTKKLLDERNAARADLKWIIHYFGHYDQDANHAWMVRRIRAVLGDKDPTQVEGWRSEDSVRKPRVCDSCKTREPVTVCEDCIVEKYEQEWIGELAKEQESSDGDAVLARRWIVGAKGWKSVPDPELFEHELEHDTKSLAALLSLTRTQEKEKHLAASLPAAVLPPPKPKVCTTACAGCGTVFQYEK